MNKLINKSTLLILLLIAIMTIPGTSNAGAMEDYINRDRTSLGIRVTDYTCDDYLLTILLSNLFSAYVVPPPIPREAVVMTVVLANVTVMTCWWSVVRNPVAVYEHITNIHDPDYGNAGKYKHVNKDGRGNILSISPTTDYEQATQMPKSNFITICLREALPIFSDTRLLPEEEHFKTNKLHQYLLQASGPLICSPPTGVNQTVYVGQAQYKTFARGNQICAKLTSGLFGIPSPIQEVVGCHLMETDFTGPMCGDSVPIYASDGSGKIISYDNSPCFGCYISASCWDANNRFSLAFIPISSVLVQCFSESLDLIIKGGTTISGTICNEGGMLKKIQQRMAPGIAGVIMLSIIFLGIKILISSEPPKQTEIASFILKIAFVLYFTSPDGGMREYYDHTKTLTVYLMNMVMKGTGNPSICRYETADYVKRASDLGITALDYKRFEYLSLWDNFDCRLGFYLGTPFYGRADSTSAINVLAFIPLLGGFLFAGQILLVIMALACLITNILLILWIVQIYVLSLVFSVIIFMVSPLFIPMIMFSYTKPFFDGWLKELIAYTIYPVVITGYMSFVFTVVDTIYFGDTVFDSKQIKLLGRATKFFYISDESMNRFALDPTVKKPLGYLLSKVTLGDEHMFLGIYVTKSLTADLSIYAEMLEGMGMLTLMLFLFYHFASIITGIAGELAGGSRAAAEMGGSAMSPGEMAKKAANTAMDVVSGGANKARREAMKKVKETAQKALKKQAKKAVGVGGKGGGKGGGGGDGGGGGGGKGLAKR